MIKKLLLVIIALASYTQIQAQANKPLRYWEAGFFAGSLNYNGSVNEGATIGSKVSETRPHFGIILKRNFSSKFNLNSELAYGKLYADDKNHSNSERGFIVKTDVIWANVGFEFHFKKFGKYFRRNSNTPFIGAGAGVLFYSPKLATGPSYEDYNLYPGTDNTYNIMFAFGWKWRMKKDGLFGISFNYHTTGTEQLEGFTAKEGVLKTNSYYGLRLTFSKGFFVD